MANLRLAIDSAFWDLNVSSPQLIEGTAKAVPGEPSPLALATTARTIRPLQLSFLANALPLGLIPSLAPSTSKDVGSFAIQSFLFTPSADNWWMALVGQFRPKKLITNIKKEVELGLETFRHGDELEWSQLKRFAKHFVDKSLYAVGFFSQLSLTTDTSLLFNVENHGDKVGRRTKAMLLHKLENHDVTLEAAWPELFVDSKGSYWNVPTSISLDVSSLIPDSGLGYRFGLHKNDGQPQALNSPSSGIPLTLLPGLCAKAAFSYEKSIDLWRKPEKDSKARKSVEELDEYSYDVRLGEPHAAISGIVGGTCAAWFGGDKSTNATVGYQQDVSEAGQSVILNSKRRNRFSADMFGSLLYTLQLGEAADGNAQPFEMSEIDDCFITALVLPSDDNLGKERDRGIKCEGFGRIECWSISGYDEGSPVIWVSTEIADYECAKPAGSYKKFYDLFYEKACICVHVYQKLAKTVSGNSTLSLEELLASVIRSMSGTKNFPAGSNCRDFVISLGEFIYNQLIGLDESSTNNNVNWATMPTLIALRDECGSRSESKNFPLRVSNQNLRIKEGEVLGSTEDEDEKLARLLQEEENWKAMRQQKSHRAATNTKKNIYIKINEIEIANDYPLPAYYRPSNHEMDEYLFFESENNMSYSDLPRRILDNWALYNSDSRLISLELLPMKSCAEIDVTIFGSGQMREDDGSGFELDNDLGLSSSSRSNHADIEGVPIYLSAIKEWMIEFGASMIFISIRTDVAWYRLGKPAKQYDPWHQPVLKTAKLAISIITLLKEQSRVSKLSFADVIKKVSEFSKTHPAYISSNLSLVERYIVVHGQIILQQFAEYPDETIRKSAFIIGLSENMEQRSHTKLIMKKKALLKKEENLNPCAAMGPTLSSRKVMRATTTRFINKIWGDYYLNFFPEDSTNGDAHEPVEIEGELEDNEDDEVEEENALVLDQQPTKPHSTSHSSKLHKEIQWEGKPNGKMDSGETLYRCAIVRGHVIEIGGAVTMEADVNDEPSLLFVEYMFEKHNGVKMAHGRVLLKGSQTILGNAADERELFLSNDCMEVELGNIKESIVVDIRLRPWGHQYRKDYANADKIDRAKAEENRRKGLPMEFYCKVLYNPERGGFFVLPHHSMGLGNGVCGSCKEKSLQKDDFKLSSNSSFVYKRIEYTVQDFLYVRPQFFDSEEQEDLGTFKSGRNVGLKAYVVCQILEIPVSKQHTLKSAKVKVRRFYRPEDISSEKAYSSDIREVYYSENVVSVPVDMIEGKCEVRKKIDVLSFGIPVLDDIFFCEYCYDPVKGTLKQLPANIKVSSLKIKEDQIAYRKKKGKEKCGDEFSAKLTDVSRENHLATLDIFAGCGGLSAGLQHSGVSYTKWAIEYEEPAGEAFRYNHPEALMFVDNCNVILRAIMEKYGDSDDCISTSEAADLAASLDEEKLKNLPKPGEVDFINGGPPCQGFSGMNRFNRSTWSKVQCEMILAFLSFAEYFRPKFFLLENVRNFVSFNKGQTFRLTLASLLAMGYQVRFGILEAGAYGVSQSRKRAFIWAASPEETLPEWPEPIHVFATPELKISMPRNGYYTAVRSTAGGAPFRSITVRDTIGDLPPVANGAAKPTIDYGSEPISWFQKNIRSGMSALNDHISKEMNELNLIRCQRVPKRPGADWRDLPDEKVKLSTGQMVDLIPWCLPNTAKRHNQWKGLFGRLDWDGNFPTSITDPQPMGKVGMCFHPDQDRILTVRECARSQGFPDSYQFSGNVQNKHRQIGNAVPPPLAYALGRKLKEAVERKQSPSA